MEKTTVNTQISENEMSDLIGVMNKAGVYTEGISWSTLEEIGRAMKMYSESEINNQLIPCNNCGKDIKKKEHEHGMGDCLQCFPN